MLGSPLANRWTLDPDVVFLNHGSFGACPKVVLEAQSELRARLEANPVRFFLRELEGLLDDARAVLAEVVGARAENLVLVPNVTTAVNAVLRSCSLAAGDEILTTSHAYGACLNVLRARAAETAAKVVIADVPFPLEGPEAVVEAVLERVTPRTKLVLLDHVTSPTGLVFPVEELVLRLEGRGIPVLVDGAHAPGMVPLALEALGASYYAGNCHKWLCAPKGAGFLHVRQDRQAGLTHAVVSHGWNATRPDRSRFLLQFDWVGTVDPTPWLAIPKAIRFLNDIQMGGLDAHMARNRSLCLAARARLAEALGVPLPAPDPMIGALAALPLPDGSAVASRSLLHVDPLALDLAERHRIEVPVFPWPAPPRRLLRISAQAYNAPAQYEALAAALADALDPSGERTTNAEHPT